MPLRVSLLPIVVAMFCVPATADEKYTLREKLKPGQTFAAECTFDNRDRVTTKPKDKPAEISDVRTRQSLKMIDTVLEVKDGSSVKTRIQVDPSSTDTVKAAGADETKTPFAFAGKTVTVTRGPDGSVSHDPKDDANTDDADIIDNQLNPDQDFYPGHPVAIGNTWVVSEKLAAHVGLGKEDKLKAECRLDWVTTIDGKEMAQLSVSCATVRHQEGNVEADVEERLTLTVDIAAGMIVEGDQTGKTTYSTPANEPVQVTGTTESKFHVTITNAPATQPVAKP